MAKGRKYIVISVINGRKWDLLGSVRSSTVKKKKKKKAGFRITPVVKDSLEERSLTHSVPPPLVLGVGEMIKQSKRHIYSSPCNPPF